MLVKRANVELTINDDEVDRYMALGYSVIDAKGNILKEAIPTDIGALQNYYVSKQNEIKQLKAKIASLELKLSYMMEKADKQEKPVKQPKKQA